MNQTPGMSRSIARTRNVILGLVLQGGLALYFADKVISLALRAEWELMIANALAAALSGYTAGRLATRIAEKLER